MPNTTTAAAESDGEVLDRIPTWITAVDDVVDVTARIRQVTVAGGLEGFVPRAPDQFVYVLAPPPGRRELTIDHTFSWQAYQDLPEGDRPVGAYYTVRRWDPLRHALDLWVVQHGHGGHGERWAATARPGDPVALWGPRQAYEPPAGRRSLLLLGDETALPAIAAILESLGPHDRVSVVACVDDGAHALPLASEAALDVSWVVPTADDPNPLLTAVRQRGPALRGATYVWGGAESHDITAVRRHVRDVVGLVAEQVSLTGYWRRGG